MQYKEHACPSAGEATGPEHSQWSWRRLWREEVQQVPFCRKALDRAPQERDGSRLLLIFTATWNDNLPNQERRLKQSLSWQGQKGRAEQKTPPAQSFRKQEPGQRKGQLGPGRERRPAREMGSRANRGDEALWSQPHRMMGGAQRVVTALLKAELCVARAEVSSPPRNSPRRKNFPTLLLVGISLSPVRKE